MKILIFNYSKTYIRLLSCDKRINLDRKFLYFHRKTAWLLVISTAFSIITGYGLSRNWFENIYFLSILHSISEIVFISLLLIHPLML